MGKKRMTIWLLILLLVFLLPQSALASSLSFLANIRHVGGVDAGGSPIPVIVPQNGNVTDLKTEIQTKTGAAPSQQILVHYSRIMEDGHPLYEYDLYDGATIDLWFTWEFLIREGSGGFWLRNSSGGLTFIGSGDYTLFQKVMVDGNDVNPGSYTTSAGSTVITLKPEYLQTLSLGTHSIAIVWQYGTGTGTFSVLLTAPVPPTTGDASHMPLWIALGSGALLALAALWIGLRRRAA